MTAADQPRFRVATGDDAGAIASLHADSWRRHYRGVYSDSYLDGDVHEDRRQAWQERLNETEVGATVTILAVDDSGLVGFAHTLFDADPEWGSLLDNLHVSYERKRHGIGRQLMRLTATEVIERDPQGKLHLWVLEQNTGAQAFYSALGGSCVERRLVESPGGVPGRIIGTPAGLRLAWADPARLLA